jgi:FkbM family methyltransferase
MTTPFVSHAQNGEDVVLWRALGAVENGRYIDVGANHPVDDSVTWAFYQRGWRGLLVDPHPDYAALLREQRPDDAVEQVAVSDRAGIVTLHAFDGTGLSTVMDDVGAAQVESGFDVRDIEVPTARLSDLIDAHGLSDGDIHFLSIDTEGAEPQVISSIDFSRHRPWVLVVEATSPGSTRQVHDRWEPTVLAAGYQFVLFDGLSRFYVADEHADRLRAALSYPACVLDGFIDWHHHEQLQRIAELDSRLRVAEERSRVAEARSAQLEEQWHKDSDRMRGTLERVRGRLSSTRAELKDTRAHLKAAKAELRDAGAQLDAMRASRSWRLTAPLRSVRRRG